MTDSFSFRNIFTEDNSFIELPEMSKKMNAAEILLKDRYPERNFALNEDSEMLARVISGSAELHFEGKTISIEAGSTVTIHPHTKYFWVPTKIVHLYIVSSPPWTKEQSRNVE